MKPKILLFGLILLVAVACSKEATVIDEETAHPKVENLEEMLKAPPNLKVVIDGVQVSAILGAHEWSYFDEEEGEVVSIEAETISPAELAENQKAPSANTNDAIELNFEKEPNSYEIYIWGTAHRMKGPYSKVVLDEFTGKTICEVAAVWEQGTAHYVFSLDVK